MAASVLLVDIAQIFAVVILVVLLGLIIAYNVSIFLHFGSKKAPYVGSFARQLIVMQNQLKLKPGGRLVDLGCGDGKAMRFFLKNFALGQIDGYEINMFAIWLAKLINVFVKPKHLKIYRKDFSVAKLENYDYVYVYLLPAQLARIEDWLFEKISPDAVIIANSFQFAKHKPYEILKTGKGKNMIFLYMK